MCMWWASAMKAIKTTVKEPLYVESQSWLFIADPCNHCKLKRPLHASE